MTKLPAPSISSTPMPPPAVNTANTVRCEVSLASSVVVMVTPARMRLERLRRDQRLAAQHAVLIAERKAHGFELAPLDLALDRGRGAALLAAPQVVAVDEAQASIGRDVKASGGCGQRPLAQLAALRLLRSVFCQ